jgi:hypothetical protein
MVLEYVVLATSVVKYRLSPVYFFLSPFTALNAISVSDWPQHSFRKRYNAILPAYKAKSFSLFRFDQRLRRRLPSATPHRAAKAIVLLRVSDTLGGGYRAPAETAIT